MLNELTDVVALSDLIHNLLFLGGLLSHVLLYRGVFVKAIIASSTETYFDGFNLLGIPLLRHQSQVVPFYCKQL